MEAQNFLSGAIVLEDLPLVEFLQAIQSPVVADVNGLSPYFGRPLPLVAAWGHLHIVRHLLHDSANPHLRHNVEEDRDWDPQTDVRLYSRFFFYRRPMGSALQNGGHEDIVRPLLEPKYRLSPTKPDYLRAIVTGARGGHLHLIQLLFQTVGKDVSHFPGLDDEMLWEAVRHNRTGVVQMLLHSGTSVNSYPWPNVPAERGTLSVAAAQGNVHKVRRQSLQFL